MKKLIIISFIFFILAIGVAIYIWSVLQQQYLDESRGFDLPMVENYESSKATKEDLSDNPKGSPVSDSEVLNEQPSDNTSPPPTSVLTPAQLEMAEKFGLDLSKIQITDELISCAKDAVGEGRYQQIIDGSAPTFLEGLSLVGCVK